MPFWSKSEPCSNCGGTHGKKLQCAGCGTVGCQMCIGGTGRGVCKICKKVADRRPMP
jgi:hypothetical protein